MSDFLEVVARERRAYVAAARAARPLAEVERAARKASFGRGTLRLSRAIREHRRHGRLAVIAEIKRVSPALGPLAEISDPAALARTYVLAGAAAVSVLVEPHHWGGSLDDIRAVRVPGRGIGYGTYASSGPAAELPLMNGSVLAKDVIVDAYQIAEAGAAGADAVLLIAEVLADAELARLIRYADELGMDALVEAHEPEAFARAVRSGAPCIGVNARDLREPSRLVRRRVHELVSDLVTDQVVVAESGIASVQDALALPPRVDAILVGTALVTASDPAALVRALASIRPAKVLA
jgi:indole-3-glycerol phosphate synthase